MKKINFKNISFKRYPITFILLFLITIYCLFSLFNRFFFTPKILLLCVILLLAAILGKLKLFLKDWFVFLSFIYLFDSIRGLIFISICKFNLPVYTLYVIKMEKFLFGEIPSILLQKTILNGNNFTWFEKFLTVMHGTHFVAFLFIGLIIWLYKSNSLRTFKISFCLVTFLGVSGYFLIPTVPPWIASEVLNLIPKIIHFNILIYNMYIPDITAGFATNPIAAMPSLHAAFPILSCLILWKLYRWKGSLFYIYSLIVLFAIVYTGDHYIVDIIAGAVLAFICFWSTFKIKKIYLRLETKKELSQKYKEPTFFRKNVHLVLGAMFLTLGMTIGLTNKSQFEKQPEKYDFRYVPYYVDFFKHGDLYNNDYHIQYYFGNHSLHNGKVKVALTFFERALDLNNNIIEKKQALMKIRQCEILLMDQKNKH